MKIALQIASRNVDVPHSHLGINVPEQFQERRQAYPARTISLAYVRLSWCGTMRVGIPTAATTSGR
jgi:hypothetical protein